MRQRLYTILIVFFQIGFSNFTWADYCIMGGHLNFSNQGKCQAQPDNKKGVDPVASGAAKSAGIDKYGQKSQRCPQGKILCSTRRFGVLSDGTPTCVDGSTMAATDCARRACRKNGDMNAERDPKCLEMIKKLNGGSDFLDAFQPPIGSQGGQAPAGTQPSNAVVPEK